MKIAYFTDTYRIGGAEHFLRHLVAGVAEAGHEVSVISPQVDMLALFADFIPSSALVHTRVDYSSKGTRAAQVGALCRSTPELRAVLKRASADVLHINNGGLPGSDLNRLAAIVARTCGAPRCVMSIHNPATPRGNSIPALQAAWDAIAWRAVDMTHASSEFVRLSLKERRGLPLNRCVHIPYGVVEPGGAGDAAAIRARLLPNTAHVLVGMVAATPERHKGHHLLLEALASTPTETRAVIVGPHPGPLFDELAERLGLRDRVTVVGPVAAKDVGGYLRAIDLLVVPSTAYESLPLVILEAMAVAKPVIASRLAGIPEAVIDERTGRLFMPGRTDELSSALLELVQSSSRRVEFGRAGRERWERAYSPAIMREGMLALYESLLGCARA